MPAQTHSSKLWSAAVLAMSYAAICAPTLWYVLQTVGLAACYAAKHCCSRSSQKCIRLQAFKGERKRLHNRDNNG
eukprot:13913-Heterococcus_DN1.PRE.1